MPGHDKHELDPELIPSARPAGLQNILLLGILNKLAQAWLIRVSRPLRGLMFSRTVSVFRTGPKNGLSRRSRPQ